MVRLWPSWLVSLLCPTLAEMSGVVKSFLAVRGVPSGLVFPGLAPTERLPEFTRPLPAPPTARIWSSSDFSTGSELLSLGPFLGSVWTACMLLRFMDVMMEPVLFLSSSSIICFSGSPSPAPLLSVCDEAVPFSGTCKWQLSLPWKEVHPHFTLYKKPNICRVPKWSKQS